MRVAIIGDIHANAEALQSALNQVNQVGYDQLVFLGDLLTYGVDVEETIELILAHTQHDNTVLLKGNHDVIYHDLLIGESSHLAKLPAWISESVQWTQRVLPVSRWNELPFCDEYVIQDIVISHANLFGQRRWEYVNSLADHETAAALIKNRALRTGVFGHTHRRKWFRYKHGNSEFLDSLHGSLHRNAIHILNPGSIGQPRDTAELLPCILWLTIDADMETEFLFQKYEYDVESHLGKIAASGMSQQTIEKIFTFFARSYRPTQK